ncbi:hypothetical protein Xvie_03895 [Xenorhabdus vietnamensis]|uniref:Uncharacterized protein n=1 Tax=Xenorhabdus vietnamensis TaxID=351656 RepID=A0A1Y2S6H4_9GAMM|nr:hypothetical protein [Xenorhabdus vietnamensis]OTA14237.1 hypothetical protein Xvie_03895 [Xenorhabdus vietnamensis]UVN17699.1 hypothetical protein pXVIEV2_004 [Xenorhabdus vietnamensis]
MLSTATPTNPSVDVISAEKPVAPENLPDEDAQSSVSSNSNSKELLLDIAAPANSSADAIPTEKPIDHASEAEKLPDEDVQGIANAVINDSMVKATEEAQKASHTDTPFLEYEASKSGISGESTPAPSAVQQEQVQPEQSSVEQLTTIVPDTASTDLNSDDSLKNYTGQSSEAVFHVQSQNTVYVYGTFAAKVYLLPMAKGEKINAYLSDSKGWEVSQLPGNILRIKRAQNKAAGVMQRISSLLQANALTLSSCKLWTSLNCVQIAFGTSNRQHNRLLRKEKNKCFSPNRRIYGALFFRRTDGLVYHRWNLH